MNFLGLHIAANSLQNSQKSLDIISQNIANAQVEGYSRQEARQEIITYGYSLEPAQNGTKSIGSRITEISRFRDTFLDTNWRREEIKNGQMGTTYQYLNEVAEIFTDESDSGLPQLLNDFWQSWNEAANDPRDLSVRGQVIQKASTLTQSIRMKGSKIDDMSARIDTDVVEDVNKLNSLIGQLASINDQLIPSIPKTFDTNILMDKRDQLLDQISKLADVQIVGDVRDTVAIYLDGAPLLVHKDAYPLKVQKDATGDFHFYSSDNRELQIKSGAIRGLLDVKETYVPQYKQMMDDMANALIANVNDLHRSGFGLDGTTNLDFFSGTGASDIGVSMQLPEHLALSVAKMSSTSAINNNGVQVQADQTLAHEIGLNKFATVPDANGTIQIVNGANTYNINWDTSETLQTILTNIQTTTGLKASFDYNSQKVILSSPQDGGTFSITDTVGNFTSFTSLVGATVTGGEPGDGSNGLNIFELATKFVIGTPPTTTINGQYQNVVSQVGYDASISKNTHDLQEKYIQSLDGMRQQISGVSTDEEMVSLMKYERAYQASAKLTTILNDTLQSLLDMVS